MKRGRGIREERHTKACNIKESIMEKLFLLVIVIGTSL